MPGIPATQEVRGRKVTQFQINLCYIVRPCLKKTKRTSEEPQFGVDLLRHADSSSRFQEDQSNLKKWYCYQGHRGKQLKRWAPDVHGFWDEVWLTCLHPSLPSTPPSPAKFTGCSSLDRSPRFTVYANMLAVGFPLFWLWSGHRSIRYFKKIWEFVCFFRRCWDIYLKFTFLFKVKTSVNVKLFSYNVLTLAGFWFHR
jgi:hypothetical protein